MNTSRKDFLKFAGGAAALAASAGLSGCETLTEEQAIARKKFAGLETLGPVMPELEVRNSGLKGRIACKYVDDVIWFLRDIARTRPKSIFDHPYLRGFRKVHEETGLKVQFNLFYRTDFFYGMDEFTLADMPADYKAEFQANADWIKFGFHSLQEFPDYPWINADYADVEKCLGMIRREIVRFAGDNMFARALIPHWVPISKDGVRALADAGIKIVYATVGTRYAYNGDASTLPYGHAFRLVNNRKRETALFTRDRYMAELACSICGYNHIDNAQNNRVRTVAKYLYDPVTKMGFRDFCTRPMSCINIHSIPKLKECLDEVKDAEFVGYGNHEQYFFKEYFAYQSDYAEKILVMSEMMANNGYGFIFIEDLVA
jgi:hypothetical protein